MNTDPRIDAVRLLEIFGDKLTPQQRQKIITDCQTLTPQEAWEIETLVLGTIDRYDELRHQARMQVIKREAFIEATRMTCVAVLVASVTGFATLLIRPDGHKIGFNYGLMGGAAALFLHEAGKEKDRSKKNG